MSEQKDTERPEQEAPAQEDPARAEQAPGDDEFDESVSDDVQEAFEPGTTGES